MDCLKSGHEIFFKAQHINIYLNSHTVTYKSLAQADCPKQLEFNCSGHSHYYIHLVSLV
jgi:hypothetical protein